MKHIAIVGSGPAGCYLADQLLRLVPDASVDILEKLPVPFGLIRYGVAPDHQNTKAVARVFDRVLGRERVSFFGNVEVGRDVRLDELRSLYDAVALATGAARDRQLGIEGEDLPGVIGSGAFVAWYNGHPQAQAPAIDGVHSAVIVGNGNVAIDVARILAKSAQELAGSDVSEKVSGWLSSQPLHSIHIVGRRGPAEAKFTDHELEELGTLQRARPVISDMAGLQGDTPVVRVLRTFAESKQRDASVSINFDFHLTPTAFLGEDRLRAVRFQTPEGTAKEIPAQLAVTCIGYETLPCCTATPAHGVFANEGGRIDERLYVVGWAKRGPTGTIPTNRAEAQQVAQKIAQEIADGQRPGGQVLRKLLDGRGACWVDYAGWRRIDAAELSAAGASRCRVKIGSTDEMLDIAQTGQLKSA